jgi:hypothetical protein
MELEPKYCRLDLTERFSPLWNEIHRAIVEQSEYFAMPNERFLISDLEREDEVEIETMDGSFLSRRVYGELFTVGASNMAGLAVDDLISLNGASIGDSTVLTNVIGRGCSLSYRRWVNRGWESRIITPPVMQLYIGEAMTRPVFTGL